LGQKLFFAGGIFVQNHTLFPTDIVDIYDAVTGITVL
jgi:hypothetical protein